MGCAYGLGLRGAFDPSGLQTVVLGANVDAARDRVTIDIAGALPGTEAIALRPVDGVRAAAG